MVNFTRMHSFDHPHRCTTCGNLKSMPYSWNSSVPPMMCTCPKTTSLAWECPRCRKMNAPWKGSCDCASTSGPQLSKYLIDEIGHWNFHGPHYNPYWTNTPNIVNKDNEV